MHYAIYSGTAILLWSSLALLVTFLNHLPPFLLLGITLTIGGSLSIFFHRDWQLDWKLLSFGVVGIFGYHFLLFMALRLAEPVEANLINYLWPLLIVLLAPILLKEFKFSWQHLIGGVLGFIGVFLLINSQFTGIALKHFDIQPGYLLAFAAAIFWASYSLLSKRLTALRTATVGLFCLLSGLLSLGVHLGIESTPPIKMNDLIYLFALGIGPMGIAFYAWDIGLKRGDPRVIGTISYLTPMLSTFILLLFTDRDYESHLLWAMLLIVGGAFLGSFKFRRR